MKSQSGMKFVCVTLLVFYSFMESQSAGKDLVLPCFIKPNISAVNMTVEWFRLHVEDSLVHLYKDHEDRYEKQAQSYKRRTSLFKEELQKGNASLKLSAVRLTDEGEYKCLVEDKSWYDDITVQIMVDALGSPPVITMESYDNSGGVNLVCESRGWKPAPNVLWLNSEGAPLPAEETQIHRDTEVFSVKRRITVHDYSDSNRFYCLLQQKHHRIEAEIIVNSKVFEALYCSKLAVGISVTACLIAFGVMVTTLICYKKELQKQKQRAALELQEGMQKTEFIKKKKFSVNVTLDPDTAHPRLILSDNGKEVWSGDAPQDLPGTQMRFDFLSVLGHQSFSSGRAYYEVQVSGKSEWTLGIVSENIDRKKWIPRKPQNGFWTVKLRNGNQYSAYADPDVPLTLREKVEKVGVFVDYEEGLVSFYDVKSRSHIYSFTDQFFTEKLYPYFSPLRNDDGKNSAPLIITDTE
ncbi:butyrophilin subfamily 1 member A1-like isoform X3 [Clarias gariepinus]|uniref:butyrophilin subfamily 1 member A1-like isoform X3 n=1 Tax=Clarias gariepinus TaxID=13013 RepID=UPI00234C83B1|nr:butyrophilin subfamily 1 member A1-like isoform X3 [Clarias gariepinus]XP_053347120.1 butyrophilin subfamily 1 member A1-like isoform X3 [Clarias gariepinus]